MLAILLTCGSIYNQEDAYFIHAESSLKKVGIVAAIEFVLILISGVYAYIKLNRASQTEILSSLTFDSFTKALSTC